MEIEMKYIHVTKINFSFSFVSTTKRNLTDEAEKNFKNLYNPGRYKISL